MIQERDAANTPTVSYTRGSDLSGSLEGAGGIGGLLARSTGNGSTWTSHAYYHADGNGNITTLLDGTQSVVAAYRYDPFGNTLTKTGTLADANLYRFSSKELHAKTGMYYYLYRFYDPNLQRWMNRDPIGELGGPNLYGFVRNSPTLKVDPYGLLSPGPVVIIIVDSVAGAGAVCGAGATAAVVGTVVVGGAVLYVVSCIADMPPSPVIYPSTGPRNRPPMTVTCPLPKPADPKKDQAEQECLDRVSKYDEAVKRRGDPPLTREEKQKVYDDCMAEHGYPVER